MFNITTTKTSNANGRPQVIAKGAGKQRTVSYDLSRSLEWNMGAAAGTLLDVLVDDQQRAKILHPSGRQRVVVDHNGAKSKWQINL